jgi:hypothetical protein
MSWSVEEETRAEHQPRLMLGGKFQAMTYRSIRSTRGKGQASCHFPILSKGDRAVLNELGALSINYGSTTDKFPGACGREEETVLP